MKRSSRVIVVLMMLLLAAVAARVYASLPFGGDDGGFVPPDKNTAKCEDAVAKNLAHFLSCTLICHVKAANATLAQKTFDEEMCEEGPTAKGTSCLERYQAAANKVLGKAICPPCLDLNAMLSLTSQGETLLDSLNQVMYCGGAPTATPTPLPTNTPVPTNTPTCPIGQTNCGGVCVNTATNINDCGGCGLVCPPPANGTATCINSTCGIGSCNAGFADCDNNPANGCEVNILGTDPNNCGGCGNHCAATSPSTCGTTGSCTAGACQLWPTGTICAAQSCSGNTETQASTCNGAGTCVPGATINCAPYNCGANACKTSCASNADCVSPATCSASVCS